MEEHREGNLYLYDYPSWEDPYVIGADVALGVGQDYSAAVVMNKDYQIVAHYRSCLLYTSPSPRDRQKSRMPSSA